MPTALELSREGKTKELWQKCCGFIDFTIDQFMTIQYQLLLEQIELLKRCELGNKLMHGAKPGSVEEFREQVPITVYQDYAPYLPERNEKVLPEKPKLWQRTSGRSSEYSYKWVSVTERVYRELGDAFLALLMFASCKERGDVALEENDKFLYGLAPPPYASGCWAHRAADEGLFDFLPPLEAVEEGMSFQERIEEGFRMALSEGLDIMAGTSLMLVKIGERFSQGGGLKRAIPLLNKPRALYRLLGAVLRSKSAGRPIMPRDLWSLKGLVSTGIDSVVYRQKIRELWGRYPLDIYGATESVIIAMQTWDYGDMTFVPNLNFLEFMPGKEYAKWSADHSYKPKTLLLNEVIPGEKYVVVITNFLGGAFVRYMLGDMVEITALRNVNLNINIPQMAFYSRIDNVLEFGGASLTEKIIWQAIEGSGVEYVDWVARREIEGEPVLHLYIELKKEGPTDKDVAQAIHRHLKAARQDYAFSADELGLKLLEVSRLPRGAFQNYMANRQAAGADLAHLKPPHINPPDGVLETLGYARVADEKRSDKASVNT